MAPHTITHCINDDSPTSLLRESRHLLDIKYRILMNPRCVSTVITFAKKPLNFIYTFKYETLPSKCKLAPL